MPAKPSHRSLSIALAAPIRPGTNSGNSVTARRWAAQLSTLGHDVEIIALDETAERSTVLAPEADLVIALHARRCSSAAQAAKSERPNRPLVVALAGTDLYQDLPDSSTARTALGLADRLVVLQDDGIDHLASFDSTWSDKAHVVHQSTAPSGLLHEPDPERFTVVVLSYLRDVKDPLLAARASRLLPSSSTVRVLHGGAAHSDEWANRATQEQTANDRYAWLGELDRSAATALMANAHVLACTSLLEGGANVVTEAVSQGVAVIGTDIGGNRGLLGNDHPGLVPVGDVNALADLIESLEQDPGKLEALRQRSLDRQWMTKPANEQSQWKALLEGLL